MLLLFSKKVGRCGEYESRRGCRLVSNVLLKSNFQIFFVLSENHVSTMPNWPIKDVAVIKFAVSFSPRFICRCRVCILFVLRTYSTEERSHNFGIFELKNKVVNIHESADGNPHLLCEFLRR